jgi:hypothetical protein
MNYWMEYELERIAKAPHYPEHTIELAREVARTTNRNGKPR